MGGWVIPTKIPPATFPLPLPKTTVPGWLGAEGQVCPLGCFRWWAVGCELSWAGSRQPGYHAGPGWGEVGLLKIRRLFTHGLTATSPPRAAHSPFSTCRTTEGALSGPMAMRARRAPLTSVLRTRHGAAQCPAVSRSGRHESE